MSGPSRLDRLESEIVAGLRDAPGPTPSSELDARILARAHAAVAVPKRRPQSRWLSLAAGITVLVGSGLALRIWQQVEHAPSALDAPQAPAAPAAGPLQSEESAAATASGGAAAADSVSAESVPVDAPEPTRKDEAKREAVSDATPRREIAPAKPTPPASSSLAAGAEVADDFNRPAQEALEKPRPFPAEVDAPAATATASAPAAAPVLAQPTTIAAPASPAPAAMAAPATAPPPPPPATAPEPQSAAKTLAEPVLEQAPAPAEPRARAAAAEEITRQLGADGALPASAADALANGAERADSERDRAAASEDQRADPFDNGVAAVRRALAAGDTLLARQLLRRLRDDFPNRELPQDLRDFAGPPK